MLAGLAALALPVATAAEDSLIRGVSYVGLTVSDLDAATQFYAEPAALRTVSEGSFNDKVPFIDTTTSKAIGKGHWRMLESSNVQLRLMQFDGNSSPGAAVPVNGPGMAHVCFQADQTTAAYQEFLDAGASTIGNPDLVVLNPRNPVVYAYLHSPDGVMFEVELVDVERVAVRKPAAGFQRIRHVSLGSPDIDRAVEFYSVLLDNPSPRRLGGEEGLSGTPFDEVSGFPGTRILMAWFSVRNLELEIVEYLSHPPKGNAGDRLLNALGYNMIVFDVASTAAARKRLLKAGGTVVAEAKPADDGTLLLGRDPDGNLLGFFEVSSDSQFSSSRFPTQ